MYPLAPSVEDLIKELCHAHLIIEDFTKSGGHRSPSLLSGKVSWKYLENIIVFISDDLSTLTMLREKEFREYSMFWKGYLKI